jgi:hypothetical protein
VLAGVSESGLNALVVGEIDIAPRVHRPPETETKLEVLAGGICGKRARHGDEDRAVVLWLDDVLARAQEVE